MRPLLLERPLIRHRHGLFGLQRETSTDREDGRRNTEQFPSVPGDKFQDLLTLFLAGQQFDLIDHDDDLFAPVPNSLQEEMLGFTEGSVRAGDKENKIAARYEMFCNLLMLADDGVGPRCIDQVDFLQPGDRQTQHSHACIYARALNCIHMTDEEELAGGGHDAFGQVAVA